MRSAGHSPEVVKHQVRPIFAETVGEDPVSRLTAIQIEDRLTNGLHTPNRLHRYFLPRAVFHLYLDGTVRALFVELEHVNKIGFAVQSAASDRHLSAGAEIIVECRLRSLVPRVIARAKPLVVNLCCHTGPEHGLAAMHRQLVRSLLRVDRQGQLVVRQLLGHTRQRDNQRASNNRKSNSESQSSRSFRHDSNLPNVCMFLIATGTHTLPMKSWGQARLMPADLAEWVPPSCMLSMALTCVPVRPSMAAAGAEPSSGQSPIGETPELPAEACPG